MKTLRSLPLVLILTLAVACSSLYTATVTITQVGDSTMKELAALSVAGKIDSATDAKIGAAHDKYRAACAAAKAALVAYKAGGDQSQYLLAIDAVRSAIMPLIDLLAPMSTPEHAATLKTKVQKANSL